jgi:carbamoyl-phosphate synthase small subunit
MNRISDTSPNAALVLADGNVFFGYGIGKTGSTLGEICFNTAMTGYQEILSDPSYAGQIITFTFPHIGNVGANGEDMETYKPDAAGLIIREPITNPSNYRSTSHFNDWLMDNAITGISGIDTRALTRHIRKHGAQNVGIVHVKNNAFDSAIADMKERLSKAPKMAGQELANTVTTAQTYTWDMKRWEHAVGSEPQENPEFHVVAIDFGQKLNIGRSLASVGCTVTIVPATTSFKDIMAHKPDGVFLSNGPGDPAATGKYAVPVIKKLIDSGIPIFGICLGHQLLALAMGGKTMKMQQGHRGANHPVKDLRTGKVEITSQNHGFAVANDSTLPDDVEVTHISLFDGTIQGLAHKTKPIFCVQGHPEASPGPHDSQYLFAQFVENIKNAKKN